MASENLVRVTVRRSATDKSAPESESRPEDTFEFEVAPTQTVGATKEMVRAQDPSIAVDDLKIDGVDVDDTATLATVAAQHAKPLVFTARYRTLEVSAGPVKRRKRCQFGPCSSAPLRGAGHCSNCDMNFCSRHRLMEQHQCTGLQGCKQQLHERNAVKLQEQQTVAHKV